MRRTRTFGEQRKNQVKNTIVIDTQENNDEDDDDDDDNDDHLSINQLSFYKSSGGEVKTVKISRQTRQRLKQWS